jgi:hypothetical protein
MPVKIRVGVAAVMWAGAMISVFLIGARVLTFEIADSVGTSWVHTNSIVSLSASLSVCLIELVLTAATHGKSRGGTIVCSCLLVALWAIVVWCDARGSWFIFVLVTSMFWNLLLLWKASYCQSEANDRNSHLA